MAVSPGKLLGIRVALSLAGILDLIFGVGLLFFPRSFLDGFGFAAEPLTTILRVAFAYAGTLSAAWAVAIGIALKDPLGNRGLIQAVVVSLLLAGVVGFYFDFFVLGQGGGAATDVIALILGVIVWALYPWRRSV